MRKRVCICNEFICTCKECPRGGCERRTTLVNLCYAVGAGPPPRTPHPGGGTERRRTARDLAPLRGADPARHCARWTRHPPQGKPEPHWDRTIARHPGPAAGLEAQPRWTPRVPRPSHVLPRATQAGPEHRAEVRPPVPGLRSVPASRGPVRILLGLVSFRSIHSREDSSDRIPDHLRDSVRHLPGDRALHLRRG